MDGLLISDGSLTKPSKNTLTSCYTHDSKSLAWLEKIYDNFCLSGITSSVKLRKRKGHYQIRTFRYDKFYEQYLRWYPDLQEKRVPRDIDLSNNSLLKNWVYGDGTRGKDFRFCTDSFCIDDIEFLSESLRELGFRFRKVNMGKSKAGYTKYRLSICKSTGLLEFFKYIGDSDVKDFSYKWPKDKDG